MRLKTKDIKPFRDKIIAEQDGKCWLCGIALGGDIKACLDHDHDTGAIRGVLCQNCNGIEGKIKNLANRAKRNDSRMTFIINIVKYWTHFNAYARPELHPTHKTADEKRIRRNKKAKERRLKKKHTKA